MAAGANPGHRRALAAPIAGRLLFAGEALATAHPATVHGAMTSGREAAARVIALGARGERAAVVGAGAAGLAAAKALREAGREVEVIEARDRIGGRLDTVQPAGWPIPVERGANWVQNVDASDLPALLRAAGASAPEFAWDSRATLLQDGRRAGETPGREEFERLIERLQGAAAAQPESAALASLIAASAGGVDPEILVHLVETELVSEFAADPEELSARWTLSEGSEGDDLIVTGGYGKLAASLAVGTRVTLGQPVDRVALAGDGVTVSGPGGFRRAYDRVIVTAPLGVLAAGAITFEPELPAGHREALAKLKIGLLDKLWLRFDEPFWSEEAIVWTWIAPPGTPYREWYNLLPLTGEPVLLSLNGGRLAREWAEGSDADHLAAARAALQHFVDAGW
jgi:monoamine oxidase